MNGISRRSFLQTTGAAAAFGAVALGGSPRPASSAPQAQLGPGWPGAHRMSGMRVANQSGSLTAAEARAIVEDAYIYFYPLVTMDITRRVSTNVLSEAGDGRAPANAFAHFRAYPTAEFRTVVRPNFDTLYSAAWLDLTREPLIVSVPDTDGRYYLLPMLDMWSDVFAVPGKRTSGTGAGHFALVPPGWNGALPPEAERIDAPTPYVWIIARTQTNGPADYAAVHRVQDGYRLTPLSRWGQAPLPVAGSVDPSVDMATDPLSQVNNVSGAAFFAYAAELLKVNPPHPTDWSLLARMRRIGLVPGQSLALDRLVPEIQQMLADVPARALQRMREAEPRFARVTNGWAMNTDTMGVYGNYYLKRADTALVGLGANQPEDAVYPLNLGDATGQPLEGQYHYVQHFAKDELPPANAFWSLTMYDAEGFQVANEIDRYAIGDRDALQYNVDGSLDLYIQHARPADDKVSNWLPAPAEGVLGITMRLYWPQQSVIEGRWNPPAIVRVP